MLSPILENWGGAQDLSPWAMTTKVDHNNYELFEEQNQQYSTILRRYSPIGKIHRRHLRGLSCHASRDPPIL